MGFCVTVVPVQFLMELCKEREAAEAAKWQPHIEQEWYVGWEGTGFLEKSGSVVMEM